MTKLAMFLTCTIAISSVACRSPEAKPQSASGAATQASVAPSTAELPEPPAPTRGTPSFAEVKAVEPAAVELATRAEAGDKAYVAKLMNGASPDAAADMIERIKRADVRGTFMKRLAIRGPDAAGLNYHDPSHFQVGLRKDAAGKWEVARLWFCR